MIKFFRRAAHTPCRENADQSGETGRRQLATALRGLQARNKPSLYHHKTRPLSGCLNLSHTMTTQTRTETIERTLRPWGWYETVSEVPGNKIKRIGVAPGQRLSLQKHHQRAEHWVVVLGQAEVTVGERVLHLGPGEHVDIALGQVHRLTNRTTGPVEIVEVQFGHYLGEDDIVRLSDDYDRT